MANDLTLRQAPAKALSNALPIDEAPSVDLGNGITARYGLVPVGNVVENPDNARTHRKRQIAKIARSMDVSGALAPAIIDEGLMLLAGHARLKALLQRGVATMPVIQVFGLTPARKRAFLLADNRIAQDAGWDRQKLAAQMPELTMLLETDGFSVEDAGFEIAEVDMLVADFDGEDEPGDVLPPVGPPVLRAGDLLTLGNHRLLVGDCRDRAALARLCDGRTAAAAFLDPPYNVRVADIVGRGKVQHDEFAMASGEMTRDEFVAFLETTLANVAAVSAPGAVHYVCMDRKHIRDLLEAGETVYGVDNNLDLVVWNKTNAGQGGLYRQQHELIGVFRVGDARHRNNVQMGKFGRNRSNVWTYAGANTFRAGRMDDLAAHPTVKPLALVVDALKDVTKARDAVLDTFAGSGTTLLAAERTGRHCLAMEIDPKYADVVVRRWQAMTGRDAVHVEAGVVFDELAAAREAANDSGPVEAA